MASNEPELHNREDFAVTHGAALVSADLPRLAVLIPNLDGWHDLKGCLEKVVKQDYPADRLEIIVVDNGSRDGSTTQLARHFPRIRVIANASNTGFAVASNQAAAATDAHILVFLNNDVRVEQYFLRELAAPIVRGECAATSAKMLAWDGRHIDHAGGGCNLQGIAIAYGYGETAESRYDHPRRTLFACGGAMAMDAGRFRALGGFDEDFFAYYEDLDLGWRTWLAGAEVHYTPHAVCVHRHSGTSRRFRPEVLRVLQARNPLLAAFKNYEQAYLDHILPTLLCLYIKRMSVMARLGPASSYRVRGDSHRRWEGLWSRVQNLLPGHRRARIGKLALSDLVGINDFLDHFDRWVAKRKQIQLMRKRPDSEIVKLFLAPLWCVEADPHYARLQTACAEFFGLDNLFEDCRTIAGNPRG